MRTTQRFDIITLFPELFDAHLAHGVTRRAFAAGGPMAVKLWQLRDFADDGYRRVDDRPYGGGPGMLMMAPALERAVLAVNEARASGQAPAPLIHFTPSGAPLTQATVQQLARSPGAVLLCGRYEGIDARFLSRHAAVEISLGDYVLSGGELPALCLLDAVARLHEGVLGEVASHEQDSFSDGLLEGPSYTRPELWQAQEVPAVLLSGHHGRIARWRREQALALTAKRRPDLITAARAAGRLTAQDELFLASL
jgi:tRNA (guanine37-N1)-methyltransferase